MPKTTDQKGKKSWLNAQKTHKSSNWAALKVTSDELTLFSFPLNCGFLKLTCLCKSDQSEGWEVLVCTQGRLPLLTYMWYELATAKKALLSEKSAAERWMDGQMDGRAAPFCLDRPRAGRNGAWRKVTHISCWWNDGLRGWNVQQAKAGITEGSPC